MAKGFGKDGAKGGLTKKMGGSTNIGKGKGKGSMGKGMASPACK